MTKRLAVIRRDDGSYDLQHVQVTKRGGITQKGNLEISKDKPRWNCIKYLDPGLRQQQLKNIFEQL